MEFRYTTAMSVSQEFPIHVVIKYPWWSESGTWIAQKLCSCKQLTIFLLLYQFSFLVVACIVLDVWSSLVYVTSSSLPSSSLPPRELLIKWGMTFDWTCIQQLSDLTQSAQLSRLKIHLVKLFPWHNLGGYTLRWV